MYLDTIEPLLNLPYSNDIQIAIFIIKLFCSKFNFLIPNFNYEYPEFKYYLQKTYYDEVEETYNEYQNNYTNELEYYRNMFNFTGKQNLDINGYSNYQTEIQIPTYENRILISNEFLNKINFEENNIGINKHFLNLWINNYEKNINLNILNEDIVNIINDKEYQKEELMKIIYVIKQNIDKKYKLNKYNNLKDNVYTRLKHFKTNKEVKELLENIYYFQELNLNFCPLKQNISKGIILTLKNRIRNNI